MAVDGPGVSGLLVKVGGRAGRGTGRLDEGCERSQEDTQGFGLSY